MGDERPCKEAFYKERLQWEAPNRRDTGVFSEKFEVSHPMGRNARVFRGF
jgi:hypothetical protein